MRWVLTTAFGSTENFFLQRLNFSDVLMQGMLSMLLFASALHIDRSALKRFQWQVACLAVVGTLALTLFFGVGLYFVLPWAGQACRCCIACCSTPWSRQPTRLRFSASCNQQAHRKPWRPSLPAPN